MLNEKLREFRELCECSQQQVADCLNVDRSTYSYYESGRTEPSVDNLKKLARLFRVSMNELLELPLPQSSLVRDGGYAEGDHRLDGQVGTRIGDLTKEEQRLVMRFRMLTAKQRADLMLSMCVASAEDLEPEDK